MSKVTKSISYINHDVKNFIGAAISLIDSLEDELTDISKTNIDLVMHSLERALELSHNISEICGPVKNNRKSKLKIAPVKTVLNTYARPYFEKMRQSTTIAITDTYSFLDDVTCTAVDPVALARLKENILHNATSAGAKNLEVHYEMMKHALNVTFKDDGRGMGQSEIDKIMLSQHGDNKISGLGTKYILETAKDHGFFVSYRSSVGKGTTVRIVCPYASL